MISLSVIFWIFILIFALIGSLRGWNKELRVTFSMILMLFVIQLIAKYVPVASSSGSSAKPFYFWLLIVVLFALAVYHIPTGSKMDPVKNKMQNWILGCIIGACNGYLLVGTVWFYLDTAGYPFASTTAPENGSAAMKLIAWLPPAWLNVPIAVAIVFTIIVIVFI